MGRPTELALTLATLRGQYSERDGWVYADEVRGRSAILGFEATAQQVAAWLGRMSRVDAPWGEVRYRFGITEYRVTRFGECDLQNRFPGVQPLAPWLRNTV